MRILELVLLALTALALVMFLGLVGGGATVLMLVLTLLALVYFAFGFILFSKVRLRSAFKGGFKGMPAATVVIGVVTGIALSTLSIGILFKLLLMPGADEMLLVGSIESAVMIAVNIVYFLKTKSDTARLCVSRLLIFGLPAVFLLLTSPLTLVKWQYRNHPRYVEAFTKFEQDPRNPEMWDLLDLERNRIHLTPEEFALYEKSMSRE